MITRLLHIDFDTGDAAIGAYADGKGDVSVSSLLETISRHGIQTVTIHCEHATMERIQTGIAMSTTGHAVDTIATTDAYTPPRYDELLNAVWSNRRDGEIDVARSSPTVFAMRFTDLDHALNRITAAVQVLSATTTSAGMPSNHLRLTCYELAANTVEHARFKTEAREIRIGIRPAKHGIQISYRDNAAEFNTKKLSDVDVGRKIVRGERRGLGLFMLSRISESLTYERLNNWNVTTLSIPETAPGKETRRKTMSEINIMITPCNVDGTIVLRPVGTVDSATSGTLESQISELINQGISRIVVDMADVEFISSSGIGVFLGSVSGLRSRGGDLLFMNVPPHVNDVFDIVNLKDYFRTIDSIDELQPAR